MSAKYVHLIDIKQVIDHDCGNYRIGEVDYGIYQGVLESFLKTYGDKGALELVRVLAFLISQVENISQKVQAEPCSGTGNGPITQSWIQKASDEVIE